MYVSDCASVCTCMSVRSSISKTTSHNFFLHVAWNRCSVLFWRRCDMLYTSGFVDDIMFACFHIMDPVVYCRYRSSCIAVSRNRPRRRWARRLDEFIVQGVPKVEMELYLCKMSYKLAIVSGSSI